MAHLGQSAYPIRMQNCTEIRRKRGGGRKRNKRGKKRKKNIHIRLKAGVLMAKEKGWSESSQVS